MPVAPAHDTPAVVAQKIATADRTFSDRGDDNTTTEENHADPGILQDPRLIITAALKRAGLLDQDKPTGQPGSNHALDPRVIITATLRSVGLLKE